MQNYETGFPTAHETTRRVLVLIPLLANRHGPPNSALGALLEQRLPLTREPSTARKKLELEGAERILSLPILQITL